MHQTQEFGFYLECNADPLKDFKQKCENSSVCFRNLIFECSALDMMRGQVVGGGTREENYRNSGVRGVLFTNHGVPNPVLITGLCAADPAWIRVDWPFVFRSLWWSFEVTEWKEWAD